MIRKLRIRLILITMAAVLLVMIILIGGINISNYRQVVSESDEILDLLMINGGAFAEPNAGRDPKDMTDPRTGEGFPEMPDFETTINVDDEPGRRARSFMRFDESRMNSPELAYETRYFTVIFDENENVIFADTNRISAVSETKAVEYAQKALRKRSSSGFIGDYRYLVGQEDEAGCTMVIFRDCGASLAHFRNFKNISIFVSLLCLLGVGILVFIASGRVVRPVAESYEKQKRFISDAGHEIKTPLAIISADADVLEMDLQSFDPSSENEWLSDIRTQTKRLSELTADLIALSKMEETTTTLEMKDLNLSEMTKKHAGSFAAVAASGNKKISEKIEADVHIQGDKKSIDSLLSIVLDNAVKYCPKDGNIEVRLVGGKRHVHLDITNDTEEVIPEDSVKHLFERFYRTDSSRNSETGGYGIGLSMAKAIVEKHKGRIAAAFDPEKKLTISIIL